MVTLLVGFVLGLALLRAVGGATLQGGNEIEASKAAYLADAGINYGYWKYRHCGIALPYTETRQLGRGEFTVTVSENPGMRDTVKISATGKCRGMADRKQRIIRRRIRPCEYALMVNSSVIGTNRIETGAGGQNGDVYIDGSLTLLSLMTVNGKLYTSGPVINTLFLSSSSTVTGSNNYYVSPIDLSYYVSRANRIYNGDVKLDHGLQFNSEYEIIYINGKLTMKGTVSGKGLIVVNGNVEMPGEVLYANPSKDKMAMLITGSLTTKAANNEVDGFYYVHNGSNSAWFKADSDITFRNGGLAVDTLGSVKKLKFVSDPDYRTSDLGYRMRLPGYEVADVSDSGNQVVVAD